MTRKGATSPVKMGFEEASVRIAIADIQPLRLVSEYRQKDPKIRSDRRVNP